METKLHFINFCTIGDLTTTKVCKYLLRNELVQVEVLTLEDSVTKVQKQPRITFVDIIAMLGKFTIFQITKMTKKIIMHLVFLKLFRRYPRALLWYEHNQHGGSGLLVV